MMDFQGVTGRPGGMDSRPRNATGVTFVGEVSGGVPDWKKGNTLAPRWTLQIRPNVDSPKPAKGTGAQAG